MCVYVWQAGQCLQQVEVVEQCDAARTEKECGGSDEILSCGRRPCSSLLGHAALTTWTHAAACCLVYICLQEHIVGVLMAQQDSARNMQLLVGLNALALLLLLGFSGGWAATFAAGCILAVLLYVLGLEAVGWIIRQPAAVAEAVSLRRSSVTLARGPEQPLRRASRSLGGATAAVSDTRQHTLLPCTGACMLGSAAAQETADCTVGSRHNCCSSTPGCA